MIDAEMIKTRLSRLLKPTGSAGEPARIEAERPCGPGAAPGAWSPLSELDGLRDRHLDALDPAPEEIAQLLAIRNLETFVERSYLRILGRAPDLRGGTKYTSLLRFSPFHTKKRFLAKLLRSEERWRHCRSALDAQANRLFEARRSIEQARVEVEQGYQDLQSRLHNAETHRYFLEEQHRLLIQQAKLNEQQIQAAAEQKKLLDLHKPIPGLHVRLLEQYREYLAAIEAIAGARHQELDQYRTLFAIEFEEFGRQLRDFAQQREDLAAQRLDFGLQRQDFARQREDLALKRDQFEAQLQHQVGLAGHLSRVLEQLQLVLETERRAPDPSAGLIEQIRVLPQIQSELLNEQRRLFDRQEREGDRRIEQVESLVRGLVDAWEESETLPMPQPAATLSTRGVNAIDPYLAEVELFVHESYRLILRRPPEPAELAESSEQLRAAVGKLKGDFLRSLLEQEPLAGSSEPSEGDSSDSPACCRICGAGLVYKWSRKVFHNRYLAHYHECVSCETLQVVRPTWLAEAYSKEYAPLVDNPDKGRFARNFSAYHYIAALAESGVIPERPLALDFGGGYGILTQMLRCGGFEAWQADPHVPVPFLAEDRGLSRLEDFPNGSFDLVTSLEVLEHLEDPQPIVDRLAAMLKPEGTLMLSTTLYQPGGHNQNWTYLATEGGQHITFWTRAALALCARRAGFESLAFFPGDEGFFILFSKRTPEALASTLSVAQEIIRDQRLLARITAPWELTSMGFLRTLDEPIVVALGDDHRHTDARSGRGAA